MLRNVFVIVAGALALQVGVAMAGESYEIEAYLDRAPEGAEVVDQVAVGRAGNGRMMVIVNAQGEGQEPVTRITREGAESSAAHLAGRSDAVVRLMEADAGERIRATVSVADDGTLVLHDVRD